MPRVPKQSATKRPEMLPVRGRKNRWQGNSGSIREYSLLETAAFLTSNWLCFLRHGMNNSILRSSSVLLNLAILQPLDGMSTLRHHFQGSPMTLQGFILLPSHPTHHRQSACHSGTTCMAHT